MKTIKLVVLRLKETLPQKEMVLGIILILLSINVSCATYQDGMLSDSSTQQICNMYDMVEDHRKRKNAEENRINTFSLGSCVQTGSAV